MASFRAGVLLQSERAIGLALRGPGRAETLGPYVAALPAGGAEDTARVIAALRPAPADRGPLRLVLPIALCDGFLRQGPRALEAEEFIAACMRWVEDEYGVELSENDVRVCRYLYPDRQVGVVTVTRPGYLDGLVDAMEAHGLRDVIVLSPLDAMILLAEALPEGAPGATRALLHVAPDRSLALILEGGAPAFFRSIRKRAELTPLVDRYEQMRATGPAVRLISDASSRALAQEMARTVRFYRRSAGTEADLSETVLTGSGFDLAPLAARVQEETGAPAAEAPVFPGIRLGGAPEQQEWLQERWGEVALPAAVARPKKIGPAARLAEIPSRLAEVITPRRVAIAVAVLYLAILAVVYFAMKVHGAGLLARAKKVRREVAARQRELMSRQSDDQERKGRLRMMRMLLRMKYQGVFAARVLAILGNARPASARFQDFIMDFDDDIVVTRIRVSVPHAIGVREASRIVYGYMDVLRSTRLVRRVSLETPGPQVKRTQRRDLSPRAREEVEPTRGVAGGTHRITAERGARLGRDVDARVRRRRRPTRRSPQTQAQEEVWFVFHLRIEVAPPWKGVDAT